MSRTRIVGGTYNKIVNGNYYLNSKDDINIISGGKCLITANNGILYGESKSENSTHNKEIISVDWIIDKNNDEDSQETSLKDRFSILIKTKNY